MGLRRHDGGRRRVEVKVGWYKGAPCRTIGLQASLYEQDLDAWAIGQAAALRAVGDAILRNEDQSADLLRSLDWNNLAEEIEGLAKRDRRELASRLALIIEHLVKLEFSPAPEPRAGWSDTILRERAEIASIVRDSPSLGRAVPDLVAARMNEAIELAAGSLERHGEIDAATEARKVRLGRGFRSDEVLGPGLPGTTRS